jgi:hypothetical protein
MLFVDPHNFYAARAPRKNFDAAPVAPAPTQLCSKPGFFRQTKESTGGVNAISSCESS